MRTPATSRKWRPHLRTVIVAILLVALALPLTGLFFFRVYENQLIRQTESELIAQAAVLAATLSANLDNSGATDAELGPLLPRDVSPDPAEPWQPVLPRLDLAVDSILGQRSDARPAMRPAARAWLEAGAAIGPVLAQTQKATLAGFRILDPHGTVIAGGGETGLSLAHVPEVAAALAGRVTPVLRIRVSDQPPPPVYSVSRGTKVRVFLAYPVVLRNRVAGAIYVSRTPSNIVKHLHEERGKLALAALATLSATLLIGFVAARTITRPILELTGRTRRIAAGDATAMEPLAHHGTSEIAELSASFLTMAAKLRERSDHVANFANHVSHELKSPLTSIQGAAELMRDAGDAMTPEERARFLENMIGDSRRMTELVRRLFDLARAEAAPEDRGPSTLAQVLTGSAATMPPDITCTTGSDIPLAIGVDALAAIMANLAANAGQHGATRLELEAVRDGDAVTMTVQDDGSGISDNNRKRIFEPFFTTRRAEGGTGLGLGIVRAMLHAHDGAIALAASSSPSQGARFVITLPAWTPDRHT
ncbi:MAG: HAMP domain-containing histidine kinase [Notoacmeibacter sp.]|nr:HAMP domain-containing histidine kinase [Notoacmeibacter sp.]MCC0033323.1 HAMP domain-containing histidine kinase [Brucellaceae bacterium]